VDGGFVTDPVACSRRRVSGRSIRLVSNGCVEHLEQLEWLLELIDHG
jgi:hypothetical protein